MKAPLSPKLRKRDTSRHRVGVIQRTSVAEPQKPENGGVSVLAAATRCCHALLLLAATRCYPLLRHACLRPGTEMARTAPTP